MDNKANPNLHTVPPSASFDVPIVQATHTSNAMLSATYGQHHYAARIAEGARRYAAGESHVPFSPAEREATPLHRWQRMVELFGARPALEDGDHRLSYAATNALANRLAHALLAMGLRRDRPIGLLFGIEWQMPVGILAAWKAGHFFAWFEPRQPLTRNEYMVAEAEAQVVITSRQHVALAHQLWPAPGAVLLIEEFADGEIPEGRSNAWPATNPPITITPDDPAYLVYTSGSTGTPKGSVELQRNLVHLMTVRENLLPFDAEDRVAFLLFGVGITYSLLAAWMYGGCFLPFDFKNEGLARFGQWLRERGVTFVLGGADVRTWLLSLTQPEALPNLRMLALSAGPAYREHLEAYQRYLPDSCLFGNFYSSTEFRSGAIYLMDKATRIEGRQLPAGYCLSPTTVEIWDEDEKPQARGTAGEVVIVSPYVSAGYWMAPELTARKFGVDAHGRRYYRTGDLGRVDEQGSLWVLGRADEQVKIRGNRVETAEVEVALLELPHVEEAAVIHLGEEDETRILLAFVASQAAISSGELRKQLAARLPDYMVPQRVVVLGELPRNGNGKVARPLLREMAAAFAQPDTTPPNTSSPLHTATETRVASLVRELLGGRVAVGADDNFFELGGHSLLAARLMLAIHREFGVDLAPRDFFVNPTVGALALSIDRVLAQRRRTAPALPSQAALIEATVVLPGKPHLQPLFFCLGWNASLSVLLRYQELIKRLDPDCPLYALVVGDYNGGAEPFPTFAALVEESVAAIRKVQPHGPYLLLGECLGGKLAYAVAQELTRAGESPALLMLLDAPMRPQWANLSFVGKLFARAQQIGNLPTRRLRYYHEQMAEMKWEERVDFVTARIWRRLGKGERGPTTDPRNAARSRYFQQLVDYTPTSPFAQHVPALYSRSNRHHIKEWQRLIPELDVTLVNKPHLEYLSKSADTVAATVRKEVAAVQTQLGQ